MLSALLVEVLVVPILLLLALLLLLGVIFESQSPVSNLTKKENGHRRKSGGGEPQPQDQRTEPLGTRDYAAV